MKTIAALALTLSLLTACQTTSAQNSASIGTLVGATIGALTFKNKISGAAIGGGAGLLVGYIVGNEMDKYDRTQVSRTLENSPSGYRSEWINPDSGTRYEAVPQRPRECRDGQIEREVAITAEMASGERETVYARAYRQPDGSWQLVQ